MSQQNIEHKSRIGAPLPHWTARAFPPKKPMQGRYCRMEPLETDKHGPPLFDAFALNRDEANWTYLPYGPFAEYAEFQQWLHHSEQARDPQFHVVIDQGNDQVIGLASYLRMEPEVGVIEVGHIHFSPLMQRTPLSTEAMYLMMKRVFDELGYRRYEWKCDALNEPSAKAAARLGFKFEGIFRQATIYKGRNRDTAWFSVIDSEWPTLKAAMEAWLAADNFDKQGHQRNCLAMYR